MIDEIYTLNLLNQQNLPFSVAQKQKFFEKICEIVRGKEICSADVLSVKCNAEMGYEFTTPVFCFTMSDGKQLIIDTLHGLKTSKIYDSFEHWTGETSTEKYDGNLLPAGLDLSTVNITRFQYFSNMLWSIKTKRIGGGNGGKSANKHILLSRKGSYSILFKTTIPESNTLSKPSKSLGDSRRLTMKAQRKQEYLEKFKTETVAFVENFVTTEKHKYLGGTNEAQSKRNLNIFIMKNVTMFMKDGQPNNTKNFWEQSSFLDKMKYCEGSETDFRIREFLGIVTEVCEKLSMEISADDYLSACEAIYLDFQDIGEDAHFVTYKGEDKKFIVNDNYLGNIKIQLQLIEELMKARENDEKLLNFSHPFKAWYHFRKHYKFDKSSQRAENCDSKEYFGKCIAEYFEKCVDNVLNDENLMLFEVHVKSFDPTFSTELYVNKNNYKVVIQTNEDRTTKTISTAYKQYEIVDNHFNNHPILFVEKPGFAAKNRTKDEIGNVYYGTLISPIDLN